MNTIFATYTASITELKKSPSKVMSEAHGEPVAILNHNRAEAYLVPSAVYESLMDVLEDIELAEIVKERMNEKEHAIEVNLDEL